MPVEDKKMLLEVITPERTELKESIKSLIVPTQGGSIGILYGHAPIITLVDIGQLKYKTDDVVEKILIVSNGVLELADNKITILVNTAEKPEEIDVERALRAKERAIKRLDQKEKNVDFARAEASLKRAMMRLNAVGKK